MSLATQAYPTHTGLIIASLGQQLVLPETVFGHQHQRNPTIRPKKKTCQSRNHSISVPFPPVYFILLSSHLTLFPSSCHLFLFTYYFSLSLSSDFNAFYFFLALYSLIFFICHSSLLSHYSPSHAFPPLGSPTSFALTSLSLVLFLVVGNLFLNSTRSRSLLVFFSFKTRLRQLPRSDRLNGHWHLGAPQKSPVNLHWVGSEFADPSSDRKNAFKRSYSLLHILHQLQYQESRWQRVEGSDLQEIFN